MRCPPSANTPSGDPPPDEEEDEEEEEEEDESVTPFVTSSMTCV